MNIANLQATLRQFAAERDWQPFHTPKNLATALMVEAAELAEVLPVDDPGGIARHEGQRRVTACTSRRRRTKSQQALAASCICNPATGNWNFAGN